MTQSICCLLQSTLKKRKEKKIPNSSFLTLFHASINIICFLDSKQYRGKIKLLNYSPKLI